MDTKTEFKSDLLTQSVTLTIPAYGAIVVNEENINAVLEEVLQREKEKGNTVPWIDDEIAGWFENQTMQGIDQPFDSVIYRFIDNITHQSILDEAEKTGIKKIYSYTEALKIVLQGVLTGEVDKNCTGIIAYFEGKREDEEVALFRFIAWRRNDGQLGVAVYKVDLGVGCEAGHGACFSS